MKKGSFFQVGKMENLSQFPYGYDLRNRAILRYRFYLKSITPDAILRIANIPYSHRLFRVPTLSLRQGQKSQKPLHFTEVLAYL